MLLALTFAVCTALAGCSKIGVAIVKTRLQAAPASDSEIFATIPKGSSIKVDDCTNGWCHATWNGRDGYILTKHLRIGAATSEGTDRDEPRSDESPQSGDMAAPDSTDVVGPSE